MNKPEPLTDDEWVVIETHTAIGEQISSSLEGLVHLAPSIRAGHERWEGTGYPDGLSKGRTPLASRIIFACDAYHAMTSNLPYREAMNVRTALEELRKNVGSQFCPHTVRALLVVLDRSLA